MFIQCRINIERKNLIRQHDTKIIMKRVDRNSSNRADMKNRWNIYVGLEKVKIRNEVLTSQVVLIKEKKDTIFEKFSRPRPFSCDFISHICPQILISTDNFILLFHKMTVFLFSASLYNLKSPGLTPKDKPHPTF